MKEELPAKLTTRTAADLLQKRYSYFLASVFIALAIDAGLNRLGLISERTMLMAVIVIACGSSIVGIACSFRLRSLRKIEKLQVQHTEKIETSDS